MDDYTRENAFKDFDYLIDQMNLLYQEHGNKYVVIQHKTCLGFFDTKEDAYSFINDNRLSCKCIVHQCFDLSSIYNPYKYNLRR